MPIRTLVSGLVREPLLHFTLIGLGLFLIYPQNASRPATAPPAALETAAPAIIDITAPVIDRLSAQFAATWNRPPTDAELAGLIESHVREEVLYREALALGLDDGDAVIRQRLRLKMEFVGEAAAATLAPTEAELADWYTANAAAFTPAATVAFTQVMLSDPAEAATILAALDGGADPAGLGRGTLLPGVVDGASSQAVDGAFGPGFFAAVAALPVGDWAGPVESSFGLHLVRPDGITRAPAPPLDSIRDTVLAAWRQDRAETLRDSQYQALRARYDVRLPPDFAATLPPPLPAAAPVPEAAE